MVAQKEKTDKRLELISKISGLADEMTLVYLEELKQRIDDTDTEPKERLKVFCEMDKVLRIAKQFSERVLLAEGKATENIGVGGMNRPFKVLITKTYASEEKDKESDD